jgi:hypothetical protein
MVRGKDIRHAGKLERRSKPPPSLAPVPPEAESTRALTADIVPFSRRKQ